MSASSHSAVTDPVHAAERALAADRSHADPAIWITRVPDAAVLARAREVAATAPRGPLWGVPFAVKDNIDVAGLPTTAACPAYSAVARHTAPAVQRLLDQGAVLIGKTNLDQFATGLVGVRSPYGTPRNVFDPARVPGGSSSGSGCAVAAGIVPFALGTDTAGSGRVPAAFGNVVGLKPTLGAVSTRGMVPACRSIDTISVFARTVDEALAVERAVVGFDVDDPYSRRPPPGFLRAAAAGPVRVGAAAALPLCEQAVASVYGETAAALHAVSVDVAPFLEVARLLYDGPWVAERSAAMRDMLLDRSDALHPVTREILRGGLTRRTVDAFDAFHRLAHVRRLAERMFTGVDVLLLPTAPFCPTLEEVAADPIGTNSRLGTFTNFVNLCGLSAIAVPAGFGPEGLPIGITLIGPAWSEARLAPVADRIHRAATSIVGATGLALPPPTASSLTVRPDETSLFCVGAHMSGLPLNGSLLALGARRLGSGRTRPCYRLFALGDRPGLLRAGDGSAIEGEVWAVPTQAIGTLLAEVRAPLGFGTVMLEDGACLGFLAEAEGVADAQDITHFGSWRAWLGVRQHA